MSDYEPVVCPGCYSIDDEPCAPGCIDDELRQEAEESYANGPDDECECPVEGHMFGCEMDDGLLARLRLAALGNGKEGSNG
jgi:hypothetical protein